MELEEIEALEDALAGAKCEGGSVALPTTTEPMTPVATRDGRPVRVSKIDQIKE